MDLRFAETQRAFDGVAADYDGPSGNNPLIQRLREALWAEVERRMERGDRLVDLGCGTGIDAAHFAQGGFFVAATDWSPKMVERTKARISDLGLEHRAVAHQIGIQELEKLDGQPYDALYSDLGPMNCVEDMRAVASQCARLLRSGGLIIASVIGRVCPWEVGYFLAKKRPSRALVRLHRGMVPVGLEGETVWTRYFTPNEFYRPFEGDFELIHYRALNLFQLPPYMEDKTRKRPRLADGLSWLDERLGGLPVLRDAGDHFLIVMQKRGT